MSDHRIIIMKEPTVEWLNKLISDTKKGEINLSGQRHVVVDANSFRAYRDAISEIIGHGASAVLYRAGKKHTQEFISVMLKKNHFVGLVRRFGWGREKIAEKIADILNQYGYGAARIEKIDFDGESIVLLDNSCIAMAYKKRQKEPVCSYIAGLLAGGAEAITKGKYECTETHCLAKGDKFCRFVLKKE
jgi:predicted hydrocarbon binding protein